MRHPVNNKVPETCAATSNPAALLPVYAPTVCSGAAVRYIVHTPSLAAWANALARHPVPNTPPCACTIHCICPLLLSLICHALNPLLLSRNTHAQTYTRYLVWHPLDHISEVTTRARNKPPSLVGAVRQITEFINTSRANGYVKNETQCEWQDEVGGLLHGGWRLVVWADGWMRGGGLITKLRATQRGSGLCRVKPVSIVSSTRCRSLPRLRQTAVLR